MVCLLSAGSVSLATLEIAVAGVLEIPIVGAEGDPSVASLTSPVIQLWALYKVHIKLYTKSSSVYVQIDNGYVKIVCIHFTSGLRKWKMLSPV